MNTRGIQCVVACLVLLATGTATADAARVNEAGFAGFERDQIGPGQTNQQLPLAGRRSRVPGASSVRLAQASDADAMARIADWVGREGSAGSIAGVVAQALQLNSGLDVPTRGKAFKTESGIEFRFWTLEGYSDVLMARFDPGIRVFWVVRNGKIYKTFVVDASGRHFVPNDEYRAAWKEARDIFLSKIPAGTDSKQ